MGRDARPSLSSHISQWSVITLAASGQTTFIHLLPEQVKNDGCANQRCFHSFPVKYCVEVIELQNERDFL